MEFRFNGSSVNQKTILNHPSGLFVLFFTEMWERFSYYGMRALLVLFLVSGISEGGWGWSRESAGILYGWYTGLVYLTPIIGGILADKIFGYRKAVVIGALLMTLGHASMALETQVFFYLGLSLLILGNGLFKPNISSIVGKLYKDPKDKDSGYTIFYMGINAGAFLGIGLCGYIGEKVGWSYGFGLAGIFMFLGMLQFWFAQNIFGKIGLAKKQFDEYDELEEISEIGQEIIQDSKDTIKIVEEVSSSKIVSDRIFVIVVFAVSTIFFWWAFEQAGSSMTIFASDYTDRILVGDGALIFKWVNTILTVVPMLIVTWVLGLLFKQTFSKYALSNIILGISFLIIWAIVIWMLYVEFSDDKAEVNASWFGILNSFFIISFAPLFSKLWEKFPKIPGPAKFALGLTLLGLGFAFLAYGSMSIPQGAKTASVSMFWLIMAYWLHTMGELCISPVGLSYVSKLAPAKLVGLMFGIWFASSAIANFLGGLTSSQIDKISGAYSMSGFFLIFTIIPIAAGIIMLLLTPVLKKKMHGIN